MTDIAERLREGVFGSDETKTDAVIHSHMQGAADEIERLRAECQRLAGEVSRAHKDALAWMEQAAAADADIERLRRFVQYVADYSNDPAIVKEALAHGAG